MAQADTKSKVNLARRKICLKDVKKNLNPVIFLHGLMFSKETWGDIPDKVAKATKREVYVIDARNHGESPRTKNYKFSENLEDLLQFMNESGIQKAVLVGEDMGGTTAIRAALDYPDRVERIFVLEMFVDKVSEDLNDRAVFIVRGFDQAVATLPEEVPLKEVTERSVAILHERLHVSLRDDFERQSYMNSKFLYSKSKDGKYKVSYDTEALIEALIDTESQSNPRGVFGEDVHFIHGESSIYQIHAHESSIRRHFSKAHFHSIGEASHIIIADKPNEICFLIIDNL